MRNCYLRKKENIKNCNSLFFDFISLENREKSGNNNSYKVITTILAKWPKKHTLGSQGGGG